MTLSFRTGRSGQTVQTQIRLLLILPIFPGYKNHTGLLGMQSDAK